MLNIEELQACKEMDVNDDNLAKKVGEGSIGTVYRLQKASYEIAFKCIKNNL